MRSISNSLASLVRSPAVRLVFWSALSLGLLYLALREFSLAEVWQALLNARPGWVLAGLLSVAANTLAKAIRWQVMLAAGGNPMRLRRTLMILVSSQALNWFVPGRLGDISRVMVVGAQKPGRAYVLGTLALEKTLDLAAYALLFVAVLFLIPLPDWLANSGGTAVGLTALVVIGLVLLVIFSERILKLAAWLLKGLPERWRTLALARLTAGFASLKTVRSGVGMLQLVGWTVFIWGTAALNNYLAARALGLTLPAIAPLVVLIILMAGNSVPSTPGGIGVFQFLTILGLRVFRIDEGLAFTYGILLQALVMLPAVLFSLAYFASRERWPRLALKGLKEQEQKADG